MAKITMTIRTNVKNLQDIPNVGPATAKDLALLGIHSPSDLVGRSPMQLYDALCRITGRRHDPCVIDVFISAVRYMEGEPPRKWWYYTAERKKTFTRTEELP